MEYNFKKIGERIRKERKLLGYSQHEFLEVLREKGYTIGYNRYSNIETGKYYHYDFDFLCVLSDLFKCEIGYILCEHDCKTGRNTDISKETGLSEQSIETIKALNQDNNMQLFFNDLINMGEFNILVERLHTYKLALTQKWTFGTIMKVNEDIDLKEFSANKSLILLLEKIKDFYKQKPQ